MEFLYLATQNDLRMRINAILEMELWDEMDLINGDRAIEQINNELSLRATWAD